MKKILAIALLCLIVDDGFAQAVPRNVVVEHFTNTYCPPCATRNPGLYANLAAHSSVHHISYHPSAPYPSCTLYQHNMAENDERTNFYGVYGATPRIVLQGVEVPGQTQFTEPTLFDNALGQLSSFDIATELTLQNTNTIRVKTTIYKVDTSSLTHADLYGAVVEDTLDFTTNNGEQHHYDVFRKGVWGGGVTNIPLPAMVNTSVSMMQDITVHNDWDLGKLYAIVMLHATDKSLVQASRSNDLSGQLSISKSELTGNIIVFPNPAGDNIEVSGLAAGSIVRIADLHGKILIEQTVRSTNERLDISSLPDGLYILSAKTGSGVRNFKLLKQ